MKVSKIISTMLAAGLISVSVNALADNSERGHRSENRGPVMMFKLFDENKDGVISASEIANASVALQTLDADQSGDITKADLKLLYKQKCAEKAESDEQDNKMCGKKHKGKFHKKGGKNHSLTPEQKLERLNELDKNQDTFLDETEVGEGLLKRADKNEDGLVSQQELIDLINSTKKGR